MAYISEETIKEVRQKNDIVDVIGEYLPLTQKGKNYFAVCPFHDDHSPSMSISKEKQIYRCFVCGASGNVISFVKDYEKVSFVEAVDILVKKAGLNIKIDKKEEKISPYKEEYDICNIAVSYYKNNLNTKSGEQARKYLSDRNLTKEIIDYFDIGLSLNGGLASSLVKAHNTEKIINTAICDENLKDLFNDRIMFPIKDNIGNPVAFSGRVYKPHAEPKYINTKETNIFKKGKILYNFHNAKDQIRKKHEIIISEGFMEVIRLHTIGIDNAVALMGTSFTNDHLETIKKLNCEVVLNLDQDNAGITATLTIGKMLESVGINPTVIIFTGAKDADELICEKGEEVFIKAYNSRIPFIDFKLNALKQNKDLNSAEELASYIKDAINEINNIDDEILRDLKIKWLSKEYDINEDIIRSKIIKKEFIKPKEEKKEIPKRVKYDKYDISEIKILFLMLNHPELIKYYENHLGYLNNPDRRKFANEIINFKEKYKTFDYSDFLSYINSRAELETTLKEINMYNETEEYTNEELEDYITRVKEKRVKIQIEKLKQDMKNTLDIEEKKRIANRIDNMKKEVLKW